MSSKDSSVKGNGKRNKTGKLSKLGKYFFQDTNFRGIYRRIFAYIPSNSECFNFSLVCKSLWECFVEMLERSSTRYYRLLSLNGKNPKDYTINLFQKRKHVQYEFKKGKFVSSIDEYEKGIKDNVFIKVLGDINKKYGPVCMISGGFAMMRLLKRPRFEVNDIDVFILGDNKVKILGEILEKMRDSFGDEKKYYNIYSCEKYGLVNLEVKQSDVRKLKIPPKGLMDFSKHDTQSNMRDWRDTGALQKKRHRHYYYYYPDHCGGNNYTPVIHWTEEAYGGNYNGQNYEQMLRNKVTINVFQFILKKVHRNAADVFAFFDLDICKIGYFPGIREVKCAIGFIRSQCGKINYVDLDDEKASNKHLHRITRYYKRSFIYTSIQCEPLLSFYHTHTNRNVKKKEKKSSGGSGWGWSMFSLGSKPKKPKKVEKPEPIKMDQKMIYTWGYQFGDITKDGSYYYTFPKNKVTLKNYINLKNFEKVPFEESSTDPYLATGVGIQKNSKGVYEYKKRKTSEDLANSTVGYGGTKLYKFLLHFKTKEDL